MTDQDLLTGFDRAVADKERALRLMKAAEELDLARMLRDQLQAGPDMADLAQEMAVRVDSGAWSIPRGEVQPVFDRFQANHAGFQALLGRIEGQGH